MYLYLLISYNSFPLAVYLTVVVVTLNFLFSALCLVLNIWCLYFFTHFPFILCACFQDVLQVSEKTDILPLAGFDLCCYTCGCFPANMMSLGGCKPSCKAHPSKQWVQLKLGFEKSMFLLVTVGWTQSLTTHTD